MKFAPALAAMLALFSFLPAQQPPREATPAPSVIPDGLHVNTLQRNSDPDCSSQSPCIVKVMESPKRTVFDYIVFLVNVALGLVGIAGIWVALCTLQKIERQTAATETQARHMVDSERPFLMVYTHGVQIWMKNCGKSPAQLIAFSPFRPIFPNFVQSQNGWPMPLPPQYGEIYEKALHQTNIGWVAPGERRRFDTFDPTLKTLRGDVSAKFFMYGAIKYRGMYGDQAAPFETRFCYGFNSNDPFDPRGEVVMGGDYGYNQNT